MNGRQIHRLLARMTDYVETRSGQPSRYAEYAQRGRNGYEIEHIWADHPERHTDEFAHPSEFQEYRNRIGGLLLLPKSFNASYGDLPYSKKRDHYLGQNLLARSLHEGAYDHNPGFRAFHRRERAAISTRTRSSRRPTWTRAKSSMSDSPSASGVRIGWRRRRSREAGISRLKRLTENF